MYYDWLSHNKWDSMNIVQFVPDFEFEATRRLENPMCKKQFTCSKAEFSRYHYHAFTSLGIYCQSFQLKTESMQMSFVLDLSIPFQQD